MMAELETGIKDIGDGFRRIKATVVEPIKHLRKVRLLKEAEKVARIRRLASGDVSPRDIVDERNIMLDGAACLATTSVIVFGVPTYPYAELGMGYMDTIRNLPDAAIRARIIHSNMMELLRRSLRQAPNNPSSV